MKIKFIKDVFRSLLNRMGLVKLNFQESIQDYLKHHTARELATVIEVIPSTISRWAAGKSKPLKGMQSFVIRYIDKARKKENW